MRQKGESGKKGEEREARKGTLQVIPTDGNLIPVIGQGVKDSNGSTGIPNGLGGIPNTRVNWIGPGSRESFLFLLSELFILVYQGE